MPIYDLHCEKCGATLIDYFVHKLADIDRVTCVCGKKGLVRKPSSASFRLHNIKCGGFTKTNSKSESNG